MRHPRILIAGIGLAAVAAVGGVTAASATGSPASGIPPAASATVPGGVATVHTAPATVTGQGFQDFFVATVGLAPAARSSGTGTTVPAIPAGGYGY